MNCLHIVVICFPSSTQRLSLVNTNQIIFTGISFRISNFHVYLPKLDLPEKIPQALSPLTIILFTLDKIDTPSIHSES